MSRTDCIGFERVGLERVAPIMGSNAGKPTSDRAGSPMTRRPWSRPVAMNYVKLRGNPLIPGADSPARGPLERLLT